LGLSFDQFGRNEIPNGWEPVQVNAIASVNELSIKKNDRIEQIKYIDIAAVNNRAIEEKRVVSFEDAPSRARRIVRKNDILISTVRPNLKHYTIIREDEENTIASTGFAVITPKRVDPDFLYYLLTMDSYTNYLSQIAEGQTSAYPAFNPDVIEQTTIYLPLMDEQIEAGGLLAVLDRKIELNNAINKNLEEMAQALFKRWFVDFEFPNENGELYKSSGGELIESELGLIPKGWKVGSIGDIAQNRKKTIKPTEIPKGTAYVGLEHIPRKNLSLQHFGVSDGLESNKLCFKKNDILFGKLRPYFHKVSIAPLDGVCSTDVISIYAINEDYYGYLISHLFSERLIDYVTQSSNGTKMPRTNWNDISKYSIVMPISEIANQFTKIYKSFIEQLQNNIHENIQLTQTRDTLLPKLMSGEIRVPVPVEQN
jgi:type I restriction enzyme S subunit